MMYFYLIEIQFFQGRMKQVCVTNDKNHPICHFRIYFIIACVLKKGKPQKCVQSSMYLVNRFCNICNKKVAICSETLIYYVGNP